MSVKCTCGILSTDLECDGSCLVRVIPEGQRVDAYLNTIDRIEPDVAPIDASAFYASTAISAKRTADATTRAADAIVEYLSFLERDALVQHLRKNMADNLNKLAADPLNPQGAPGPER